jgi:hypothetical protein
MNMSATSSSLDRRGFLASSAAVGAATLLPAAARAGAEGDAIRPFRIDVPEDQLVDLRQRVLATRWPDKETVGDRSQGTQLANLQELVRYWGSGYDWRKAEARLNALPQFMTTIEGLDIHFIHVRSRHPNALPVIITHGWPGSVFEQLKVIEPLTDPTAHGGRAEEAFDVVIPSIPGYGFSGKPTGTGWDPDHIARAWAELMKRIGYTRYVAQGGDWGAPISSAMGARHRRVSWASTSTCRRRYRPTWPRCSPPAGPCRRDSPRRNARRSTRSTRSTRRTGPIP